MIGSICQAQGQIKAPEKDSVFFYEPVYVDSNNTVHSLKLEKVSIRIYQQVFKTSNYITLDSIEAAFKINQSKAIKMLVKLNPSTISDNIKNYFRLFQLDVNFKESYRYALISYKKHFINSTEIFYPGMPIEFTKISDSSVMLNFTNLNKGEYLLIIGKGTYSFSIN